MTDTPKPGESELVKELVFLIRQVGFRVERGLANDEFWRTWIERAKNAVRDAQPSDPESPPIFSRRERDVIPNLIKTLNSALYRIDRLTNGYVTDIPERDKAMETYHEIRETLEYAKSFKLTAEGESVTFTESEWNERCRNVAATFERLAKRIEELEHKLILADNFTGLLEKQIKEREAELAGRKDANSVGSTLALALAGVPQGESASELKEWNSVNATIANRKLNERIAELERDLERSKPFKADVIEKDGTKYWEIESLASGKVHYAPVSVQTEEGESPKPAIEFDFECTGLERSHSKRIAELEDDLKKTRAGLHLSSQTVAELEAELTDLRGKLEISHTQDKKREEEFRQYRCAWESACLDGHNYRDRIAELEAENARLKSKLEEIAEQCDAGEHSEIARKALAGEKESEG